MYLGITSHHDAKRVTSYEDAQRALERASRTPTGKQRTEKVNGYHLGLNRNYGVTWVRGDGDGNIGFTLYDTQVVTWCPDGSVLIDNFGTVTTTGFARQFLPGGIWLRHPVERWGKSGGDKGISYAAEGGSRICYGSVVRFVQDEATGYFLPDETTCDPIDLPVLDTTLSRDLAKELNFADFKLWLQMAPRMIEIEHDEWDMDQCCAALKARDWRRAVETLPLIKPGGGFGLEDRVEAAALPIRTRCGEYVTMGSLAKLKLAVWDNRGYLTCKRERTVDSKTFNNAMSRVRELEALGCHGAWGLV